MVNISVSDYFKTFQKGTRSKDRPPTYNQ